MKSNIFSKCILVVLIFNYYNISAQDSLSLLQTINKIKQDSESLFTKNGQKTIRPNYYSNSHTFFNLKIEEVTDTSVEDFHKFNDDAGSIFGYCGGIVGGIKNLLQTDIRTMPHLHFLNEPLVKRYVLFYGQGWNIKGSKTKDTSACDNKNSFDGRDMILKIGCGFNLM